MSFVDAILTSAKKNAEYYEVLGCDRNSTVEQIQAEYRARVRGCHPDKVTEMDNGEAIQKANSEFSKLQEAYSKLSNSLTRKLYDSWLDSPIPGTFEEFSRSADTIQMSTHWAQPKQQQMITIERKVNEIGGDDEARWKDGRRYQSEAASKFRNYQL